MEDQSGWACGDMPVHSYGGYSSIPQMGPSNSSGYVYQDFSNDYNFNTTGYAQNGPPDFFVQSSSSNFHYNMCPVQVVEPSMSIVIIPPPCPEPVPQYNGTAHANHYQYVPRTTIPDNFPNQPTGPSPAPESGMEAKKREIVVVNLVDSDDDEPKMKSAKVDNAQSDAIRRENEIISFWEAEFLRSGAGRYPVFPDTFYLKDVQDMDQRPLGALSRLFHSTQVHHNLVFDYELNTNPNVMQEVRCRYEHDQDWITGYGNSLGEAKNDAARKTLQMLLGSEKYEVINEMSKTARYEGLNRSRINEAVRRKSLIDKYKSYGPSKLQNALKKLTAGSSHSINKSISGGKCTKYDEILVEKVENTVAEVEVAELFSQAGRKQLKKLRQRNNKARQLQLKSVSAATDSDDKSNLSSKEAPPENVDRKSNFSQHEVPLKIVDDKSNLSHKEVPPENVENKAQKTSSPPEGALNDNSEEILVVYPTDFAPSTLNDSCPSPSDADGASLRTIIDKCNSRVRTDNQSSSCKTDSLLGGSGTDLSEDEVEKSTEINQMSVPSKQLENEIIKFWLDRKPYVWGQSQTVPSVYNLRKIRNIKEKPKRAVDTLFANMSQRPKYKIMMDGSDFCVNWSWADIDVTGRGSTLTDAENDASDKFLVKMLGENDFHRICQMSEEFEISNSVRINNKLRTSVGYSRTLQFLSSGEKRQYDTSFDFQVHKLPKRLTPVAQPLSTEDLKCSVPKIYSKLRAFSVKNRLKDKICSVDKLAPFQNFERVEKIGDLENNAVAALGSLFASKVEEPFPVYTCVPYSNPISFKVECVVWGKYFVAEASTEEIAKNLAAQTALKFIMGNERYEEQVKKNQGVGIND